MNEHLKLLRQLVKFFDMEGCLCGGEHWDENNEPIDFKVAEFKTDPTQIETLYKFLPARYPKLFEALLLNFRWDHYADTEICRFLPNPMQDNFSQFKEYLFYDKYLTDFCIQNGYLPFAHGADINYDRFCFDLNKPSKNDYPVVQIDHEEVLSFTRIGKPKIHASSFEEFVRMTIEAERPILRSGYFRD